MDIEISRIIVRLTDFFCIVHLVYLKTGLQQVQYCQGITDLVYTYSKCTYQFLWLSVHPSLAPSHPLLFYLHFSTMPAKRRPEKKVSKKGDKASDAAATAAPEEETPADRVRREGIVVTYAQSAKKIHRNVRDISVSALTMLFHGTPLVEDAELTLNYGNRYGFIGRNGSGKSTFMKMIGARCFPIADGIDSFHLKEEIEATDMTAKEAVMSVDLEKARLEAEAEELNDILLDENCEDHDEVMDRLTQVIHCKIPSLCSM